MTSYVYEGGDYSPIVAILSVSRGLLIIPRARLPLPRRVEVAIF